MRHDFENIPEDVVVILHPADANLIHREPVKATRLGDYFYCAGTDPMRMGADYGLGEIAAFMRGYELAAVTA
ncbi:hypothetical protein E4191_07755 [Paracoccus liaowanqingii]|uniref:Uncharacterized protein n=1 Tax=Paracoccus liaowanqingii TaxID=2560053 RepID=A0A4P7HKC1_9RHOB|nr:hypothetical protein [Paracoccus liaowanqingii]QBX34619.1 hypothetical protein E4191_07755 [Paracoccus liaowanqingii]